MLSSVLSFVAVVVASVVLTNPDYQEALYARAQELGVNQNYLPAAALAQIVREREDERRRLRRDLHDGVGPLLASQLVTRTPSRSPARRAYRPMLSTTRLRGRPELRSARSDRSHATFGHPCWTREDRRRR